MTNFSPARTVFDTYKHHNITYLPLSTYQLSGPYLVHSEINRPLEDLHNPPGYPNHSSIQKRKQNSGERR